MRAAALQDRARTTNAFAVVSFGLAVTAAAAAVVTYFTDAPPNPSAAHSSDLP